jgi:ABC-type antimicrobial peptide transport system permease subunit
VQVVGFAAELPNRQPTGRFEFSATGIDLAADPFARTVVDTRMVGDGFFEAIGLPLTAGRTFTAADVDGAEPVIVISSRFAAQQFPGRDPIGQILYSGSGDRRVVGVVGDVRQAAEGAEMRAAVYLPLRQQADIFAWHASMNVIVRSSNPTSLATSVRAAVLELDPDLPPSNVRRLKDELSGLVAGPRFSATVLATFAIVALVMASLGVYGVMAYVGSQRTREIGVRVALGATRGQILRLMMRDGVVVVGLGLGAGLVLALWLARALTGLLHEVTPADPLSLVAVGGLLSLAGLWAAYIPARRATRLNVLTALRND